MNYAIVENGTVINVALSDEPIASNWIQSDIAKIGDNYDPETGVFTTLSYEELPEPVPQKLTARQARLALHSIGKLADVPAAIAALPEPQKTNAEIEWEYATYIERNNPFVAVLASALQLTDEQIDQLFIEGAKL